MPGESLASRSSQSVRTGKATGEPIKIVTMVDASITKGVPQDELVAGNRAAVRTINEELNGLGGSGRPIDLEFFETDLELDRTVEFAEKVAADPSYVAVVGQLVINEITPIFEKAGLPSIPSVACTKEEYYSPVVFNTNGAHHCMCSGPIASALLAAPGAKKIRSLTTALPGTSWYAAVNDLILEKMGVDEEKRDDAVIIPWVVDDITPYVAQVAEDVEAVHCSLAGEGHLVETIKARHRLGLSTPFVFQGMAVYRSMIEELGTVADGIHIASYYPTTDSDLSGERNYLASMRAAGHDGYVGDKSQMGWMAFDLLDYAAQGVPDFTRESVLDALRHTTDYTGGGITPPLDFSKPGTGAGYPRVHNWTYYPQKIENGTLVMASSDGSWVDLPSDIPDVDVDFTA